MDWHLLITQLLNGLQLGLLLFLLAAGLTLIFGIMDFINLAHGSFYMLGAFLGATVMGMGGAGGATAALAVFAAVGGVFVIGAWVEWGVARRLYRRNHLDHVLITFGMVLCFDGVVHWLWGAEGMAVPLPPALDGQVHLGALVLPRYRLVIIGAAALVALGLWLLVGRTRLGMLIRAGATDRAMVTALGVHIDRLYMGVFAIGAALAALAGLLIAPITEASVGMGNEIIIIALVVVIVGGIGSVKGAFYGALLIGMIDTLGRSYLDDILKLLMPVNYAETAAPALAAMSVYVLMAAILAWRPQGLFPPLRGA